MAHENVSLPILTVTCPALNKPILVEISLVLNRSFNRGIRSLGKCGIVGKSGSESDDAVGGYEDAFSSNLDLLGDLVAKTEPSALMPAACDWVVPLSSSAQAMDAWKRGFS